MTYRFVLHLIMLVTGSEEMLGLCSAFDCSYSLCFSSKLYYQETTLLDLISCLKECIRPLSLSHEE